MASTTRIGNHYIVTLYILCVVIVVTRGNIFSNVNNNKEKEIRKKRKVRRGGLLLYDIVCHPQALSAVCSNIINDMLVYARISSISSPKKETAIEALVNGLEYA